MKYAFFCGALIVARILLNSSPQLDLFVKIINILALTITVEQLDKKIKQNINDLIDNTSAPQQIKCRVKKEKCKTLDIIVIVVVCILAVLYLLVIKNSWANDVVSIFILAISLLDDYIVEKAKQHIKI